MFLTTFFYLLWPTWSEVVPAHYFVPIIMFPLISYYLTSETSKKVIVSLVVMLELLCLCVVVPKNPFSRAVIFENALSRVCVNIKNISEALERCSILENNWLMGIDRNVLMYYADSTPQRNKEYWVYLKANPNDFERYYEKRLEDGNKVYMMKGITWEDFIESENVVRNDYRRGEEVYAVKREKLASRG